MQKRTRCAVDVALGLALFAATWLARAFSASTFITWDEPAWVYRSCKFLLALLRGDPAGTMLVGHPGVLTMWSGALSLAWHRFVTGAVSPDQLAAVGALPSLEVHDPEVMRRLGALLPAAKGGIAILHALVVVGLFFLLLRLLGRRPALAGALFLLADPYYLGLSRLLHMDALTAGLMLLSVVGALVYAREARRRYLALSAAAAGLAALTKSYGVLVAPFILLLLAGAWLRSGPGRAGLQRRARLLLRDGALWGAVAVAVFVALWPAMWTAPWATLQGVLGLSLEYAATPGDATAGFFRGQIAGDPGPAFYPVVLLFRSTPLLLLGLAAALAGLFLRREPAPSGSAEERGASRGVILALAAYALFYVAVITLSKKKYDRYALPGLLALDVVAAVGLAGALDLALQALKGRVSWLPAALCGAVTPLLVLVQAAALLGPLLPAHFLAYYNPLVGGTTGAVAAVPVGLGEGVEGAAHYLAAKPEAEDLTVATWAVAGVAPFFPGEVVKLDADHIGAADYVLLYVGDVQGLSPLAALFYGRQEPEYVAQVNGVEYAWLYRNDYHLQLVEEVAAARAAGGAAAPSPVEEFLLPGDVLLTNTPTNLSRRLGGDLRCVDVTAATEEEAAAQLQAATEGAGHALYLEYATSRDVPGRYIRRQLGQSALLLWEKPFTYGTMRYYQLSPLTSFRPVEAQTAAAADFGGRLLLEGYGLSADSVQYRQHLGLALAWRAVQRPERDLHLFLRLVDEAGRTWGEYDGPLTDTADRRTANWEASTTHLSRLTLAPDAGIPPGRYWVVLGVYNLEDLARLSVTVDGQPAWATEFRLGPIEVQSPAVPATAEELAVPQPLQRDLAGGMQLLGYGLVGEAYTSGEAVDVMLYWRCLQEMDAPYELELRLVGDGGTLTAQRFAPAGPHYPTVDWRRNEALCAPQQLAIPAEAPDGDYDLYLNLYAPDGRALAGEGIRLATLHIEHRERLFAVPEEMRFPWQATLGEQIELLGYDLAETTAAPGGTLHLTLYWRALRPPDASYTVFTHLLDGQGALRGQRDSVPMAGQHPTSGWVAGEVIVDPYELPVDADAQPGTHQIEIGLYEPATGRRLPVTEEGRLTGEDRVILPVDITVQ